MKTKSRQIKTKPKRYPRLRELTTSMLRAEIEELKSSVTVYENSAEDLRRSWLAEKQRGDMIRQELSLARAAYDNLAALITAVRPESIETAVFNALAKLDLKRVKRK